MGDFDGSAGAGVGVLDGSALLDFTFGCKFGVCLASGAGVGGLVWGAEAGAMFGRAAGVLDGESGVLNPSAELARTPLLPECA